MAATHNELELNFSTYIKNFEDFKTYFLIIQKSYKEFTPKERDLVKSFNIAQGISAEIDDCILLSTTGLSDGISGLIIDCVNKKPVWLTENFATVVPMMVQEGSISVLADFLRGMDKSILTEHLQKLSHDAGFVKCCGESLLMASASNLDRELIQFFVETWRVDPNAVNRENYHYRPLCYVILNEFELTQPSPDRKMQIKKMKEDCIDYLIGVKADPHAKMSDNVTTPVVLAKQRPSIYEKFLREYAGEVVPTAASPLRFAPTTHESLVSLTGAGRDNGAIRSVAQGLGAGAAKF